MLKYLQEFNFRDVLYLKIIYMVFFSNGEFKWHLYLFFTGWQKKFPDEPLFKTIKLLDEKVAQGKFGVKSGEGFYSYKK
jgi:hypothetical protein